MVIVGMRVFELILTLLFSTQSVTDLETVLDRATKYVAQYESDLGNLIGTEEYVQNSVWLDNSNPPRVAKRLQRLLFVLDLGKHVAASAKRL